MRRGFTLIEAMVALVLFQLGMLALVATSTVAARELGEANRRARARAVGQNRVEQLRGRACSGPAAGAEQIPGGLTEYWRIETSGPTRTITDSVAYELPGGRTGSVVARTLTLCTS